MNVSVDKPNRTVIWSVCKYMTNIAVNIAAIYFHLRGSFGFSDFINYDRPLPRITVVFTLIKASFIGLPHLS